MKVEGEDSRGLRLRWELQKGDLQPWGARQGAQDCREKDSL